MVFMYVLIAGTVGAGLFLILAELAGAPRHRVSKATLAIVDKKGGKKTTLFDTWIRRIAGFLTGMIRMNVYKKTRLETELRVAGIAMTPESYYANAIAKALLPLLLAVPGAFIHPALVLLLLLIAMLQYSQETGKVKSLIRKKRTAIEKELPRFVFTIEKTIPYDRDVLSILERYRKSAGEELADELSITIADMRSGNQEGALMRLESRVGSNLLSDIVRGLIGAVRGDDMEVYFQTQSLKFSDWQRQQLKAVAVRVPGKVSMLSRVLVGCCLLMYIAVVVASVVQYARILS